MGLFYYQRPVTRKVAVENPVEGEPTTKEVTDIYWDCFNLDNVIRGHWTSPEEFVVLLDDGHEQADDVQKPKYSPKGQVVGVEVKRERAWFVSQIALIKEDAVRLRTTTEARDRAGCVVANEKVGVERY